MIAKLRSICLPVALMGSFLACTTTRESQAPTLSSGVILENMDTTVRPGDDFFAYVNGNWLKTAEIPPDRPNYGIFTELRDKSEEHVRDIIQESAQGSFEQGSDEQKVGDFFDSYMDTRTRDSLGVTPLREEFEKIDAITSKKAFAEYFGYANKLGNIVPLRLSVSVDFKDPRNYLLVSSQGGLGMPEREYYLAEDEKSGKIREEYVRHISKMFSLAGLPAPEKSAQTIMQLESRLAKAQMKKEDARNRLIVNRKFSREETERLLPGFAWAEYWKAAGAPKTDSVNVKQVDYTKSLQNVIDEIPLEDWKTYFKWGVLRNAAPYLSSAFDQEHFNFYSKTLTGTEEQRAQWRRGVSVVNSNLGEIVGKVYVKKYFPAEAKERMMSLVKNLLKAYESSIKELDWMGEETKKEALAKLSKFTPKIGYPDKWRDYSALEIRKGDLYGNKTRATLFEYDRRMSRLGKPVDRDEWAMTPQTVNAYYNSTLNEIVFPAAILQPPFFDLKAEDAVNYGGIGAVIGHEIGHGFDDQGSTSDGDGVMRNWWTENDLKEFKARTGSLIAQYDGFEVFDDLHVNGVYTLGENIGDLGGLSIALKAYRESLGGKDAPVLDGFTGEQRLLIGWAQVWMSKAREQYLRNLVATDPHSPPKFRVNGVVRNVPEFYTSFNVKPSDSLYLDKDARVKIW